MDTLIHTGLKALRWLLNCFLGQQPGDTLSQGPATPIIPRPQTTRASEVENRVLQKDVATNHEAKAKEITDGITDKDAEGNILRIDPNRSS